MVNWKNIDGNFLKGLTYFGVGAAAGALSAGVGAGVSSFMAGGAFSAGFLGTSTALTATTSFVSGAAIGGAAGFSGGFVSGTGNGLIQGKGLGASLGQGGVYGLIGGVSGAVLGGLYSGIDAAIDGRNFWDGSRVLDTTPIASVDVTQVKQVGDNNCVPASAESVNQSLGGNKTQVDFRTQTGGNANTDPVRVGDFWRNDYNAVAGNGHKVAFDNTFNKIAETLNNKGQVVLGIPGGNNGVGHSVVLQSVSSKTIEKVSGQTVHQIIYRVMDPGTGGFKNIVINNGVFRGKIEPYVILITR